MSDKIETKKSVSVMDIFTTCAAIAFFLALIVLAIITPNFLSIGTLRNTLVQVFPVMLVALGMTMVISSGGIDISVGAIMAISGAVTTRLYVTGVESMGLAPMGLAPALACGVGAACLCGLFNGMLVARFGIQPIVVTLVVMIAGRGLAQIILGKLVTSLSFTTLGAFGGAKWLGVPVQIYIMVIAVGVMIFVVKKTNFAKRVEAVGDNCRAARLVGINTVFVTAGVYVLCGVLCSIAGIMEAARVNEVNVGTLGSTVLLDAIAAVAIGGTPFSGGRARILGTVFGAIVIQLVTIIVTMNDVQFHYSLLFKAVIMIVAILIQVKRKIITKNISWIPWLNMKQ